MSESSLDDKFLKHTVSAPSQYDDLCREMAAEILKLRAAVREHRDARGDDRCWRDDEDLYATLPEGYTPRPFDTTVELEHCKRFIECRQNPATEYMSPEREIERLRSRLSFAKLQRANRSRVGRWHSLKSWSPLEWAGAMCGEAGEAANAAKKLKRIEDQIANINAPDRSLTDPFKAAYAIAHEVADAVIYGDLLCQAVNMNLEAHIVNAFNIKSEEYDFPERL